MTYTQCSSRELGIELRAEIILTHQTEHDMMFTNKPSSQPHSLVLFFFNREINVIFSSSHGQSNVMNV